LQRDPTVLPEAQAIVGAGPARVDDPRPWKRHRLAQQLSERRLVGGGVFEHGLVRQAPAPQHADHLARDLCGQRVQFRSGGRRQRAETRAAVGLVHVLTVEHDGVQMHNEFAGRAESLHHRHGAATAAVIREARMPGAASCAGVSAQGEVHRSEEIHVSAVTLLENLVCPRCGVVYEPAAPGVQCPSDQAVLIRMSVREAHPHDALLGRSIANRYQVIDVIGAGGMGAVYLALQEPIRREVAVKVILGDNAKDTEVRHRFFREARAVAALTNDHCVRLFDYGEDGDGLLYMVLEFVRGRTLKQAAREAGVFSPQRVVDVGVQVCDALAEAHAAGMIHRDLKPENIMLVSTSAGRAVRDKVKVLDFGVAKMLRGDRDDADETLHTRAGIVLGTPRYMAPEQATRRGPGRESDQYSLGVVLWELLSGRPPFTGATAFETLSAHAATPLPPFDPRLCVPGGLASVIERMLAKAPEARFPSIEAAGEALHAADLANHAATGVAVVEHLPSDIVQLLPDSTSREFSAELGASAEPATPVRGRSRRPLAAAVTVVVLGAGIVATVGISRAPVGGDGQSARGPASVTAHDAPAPKPGPVVPDAGTQAIAPSAASDGVPVRDPSPAPGQLPTSSNVPAIASAAGSADLPVAAPSSPVTPKPPKPAPGGKPPPRQSRVPAPPSRFEPL
jgi:serine/threonine protein kinase